VQANLSKRINELLVLSVLQRGPAHGYQVALSVEEETGGTFSFQHGTLYPILHRLEADGLVSGVWSDGDRRRKTYAVTDAGREYLDGETGALEHEFGVLLHLLRDTSHAA